MPVVWFTRDEYRLGGAANVAHNVASLGGRVSLMGVVGARQRGRAGSTQELGAAGIATEDSSAIRHGRPRARRAS